MPETPGTDAASETAPFPYAAVLFDMDGVVVDSEPIHERALVDLYTARGWPVEDPRFFGFKGRTGASVFAELGARFGVDADTLAADKHARYDTLFAAHGALVPGIEDVLQELTSRGIPLALATSAHGAEARAALARFGVAGFFRAVVTADDVTHSKPHPEPYLRAAAALGVDPSRCLVVEDTLHGVRAGVTAGATVAAIARTFPADLLRAAGAAWTFDTYADFRARLGLDA